MLTDEQEQQVERLQSQALKNIYDYKLSYAKIRDLAGVTTLRQQRTELADKFAEKALTNRRFCSWSGRFKNENGFGLLIGKD